jgi:hypoxanthine phosphoribosyltransferase
MDNQIIEAYSAAEISSRVKTLAEELNSFYQNKKLTVLGVTEDSFIFLADLLRLLNLPLRTSFLQFEPRSVGGIQNLFLSTQMDITGHEILLVEGVMSTGVTERYAVEHLTSRGAASVKLCVLVDKPDSRRVNLIPDWKVFESHHNYIFGYGLGFNNQWRQLPYLATLVQSEERL